VRASFPNPGGKLMPGQFARLRLGEPQPGPALLVSERAVGTDQDRKFVLVVDRDDKAEYRNVTLGAPAEGLRIVTAGLRADERIVVNGLQRIRPGSLIAPQMVGMDGATDANLQAAAAEPKQP
jgi:multidrug efflux system membrane fusion protein